MSDMWSDLPLSRKRHGGDESAVSNDWGPRTVEALRDLASAVERLTPEQWESPSLRRSDRRGRHLAVREVVTGLPAQLDRSALDRLLRRPFTVSTDPARIPSEAATMLRDRADTLAAGTKRGTLHPLTLIAQASADVTVPLGLTDPLASLSAGAVALALAAAAPAPLAAVLRGRSLAPDDAEWTFARGPAIRATSAELIAWLGGRDVIPRFDPTP